MSDQALNMAETIRAFGAPLLDDVDAELPLEAVQSACTIVITVWNAHVMANEAWQHPEHLRELEQLVYADEAPAQLKQTYEVLVQQRRRFVDDVRVVHDWQVVADSSSKVGYTLQCEGRPPQADA